MLAGKGGLPLQEVLDWPSGEAAVPAPASGLVVTCRGFDVAPRVKMMPRNFWQLRPMSSTPAFHAGFCGGERAIGKGLYAVGNCAAATEPGHLGDGHRRRQHAPAHVPLPRPAVTTCPLLKLTALLGLP